MLTEDQKDRLSTLTPRQRDCLRLVPLRNTAQIADELKIKPHTVDAYLKEAKARLGVSSRSIAATLLLEFERQTPPQKPGGQISGLSDDDPDPPILAVQPVGEDRSGRHDSVLREARLAPEHRITRPKGRRLFSRWRRPGEYVPSQRVLILGGIVAVMSFAFALLILGVVGLVALAGSLRP